MFYFLISRTSIQRVNKKIWLWFNMCHVKKEILHISFWSYLHWFPLAVLLILNIKRFEEEQRRFGYVERTNQWPPSVRLMPMFANCCAHALFYSNLLIFFEVISFFLQGHLSHSTAVIISIKYCFTWIIASKIDAEQCWC